MKIFHVVKGCPKCFQRKTRTGNNVMTENPTVRQQYRFCRNCGYKWIERYRVATQLRHGVSPAIPDI